MGYCTYRACQRLSRRRPYFVTRFAQTRAFHDYFVTHLPSSSLHPDSRSSAGPRHNLPRSASKPHTPRSPYDPSPAPLIGTSRDTTVVRIPLRSAKHHFGVSASRGQRPYNEDAYQAGVIEIPAFAKRMPISLTTRAPASSPLQAYREKQRRAQEQAQNGGDEGNQEGTSAHNTKGDPQVFYFGVYDGHGGAECSDFLRESLHKYIEEAAQDFEVQSTLRGPILRPGNILEGLSSPRSDPPAQESSNAQGFDGGTSTKALTPGSRDSSNPALRSPEIPQQVNVQRALGLENDLIQGWKDLVGGYFRRFKPALFSHSEESDVSISTILTYAFLRADYDFVHAQARKPEDVHPEAPLNAFDVLDSPSVRIGGEKRFKGGSTCSIAIISTPTPTPFWHPSAPSTLIVAHVGDTRILLCRTSDGAAVPLTTNHHPNNPNEGKRLRRFAGSFVTDSFGEERMSGLANTRAFGDMQSKRIGVSAEPEIRRLELAAAEFSFLLLLSDGVSGTLSDQEVVDIVKEARTPEQGARDVVSFATEVTTEGDNATCICIRLGGWERRSEGGLGSIGTRESRVYRREEAADPRGRRQ